MPSMREIEHLINSLKRAVSNAEHGFINISVDATIEILNVLIAYVAERNEGDISPDSVDRAKTVDAVHVVRCRDCNFFHENKWCSLNDTGMYDEDFCSYGVRKDGEQE